MTSPVIGLSRLPLNPILISELFSSLLIAGSFASGLPVCTGGFSGITEVLSFVLATDDVGAAAETAFSTTGAAVVVTDDNNAAGFASCTIAFTSVALS